MWSTTPWSRATARAICCSSIPSARCARAATSWSSSPPRMGSSGPGSRNWSASTASACACASSIRRVTLKSRAAGYGTCTWWWGSTTARDLPGRYRRNRPPYNFKDLEQSKGRRQEDGPSLVKNNLPEGPVKVLPLVVDDDKGGKIDHFDAAHRFHAELLQVEQIYGTDVILSDGGGRATDGAEIEAAVAAADF